MQPKTLLVGAGPMGRAWARNLRDSGLVHFAGWVDVAPDKAAEAAEEEGIAGLACGDDLAKALADLSPDVVIDVTPPEVHHDVTVAALAAGAHVLGEKPMAHNLDAAREMVAASEKAGKLYMVSQSRRYDPRIQAFRKLIVEYTGPLGILNADFFIGAHFGGFRDEMPSPLLLDMAIHTFDAARYISNSDAVSVYCDEFNPDWSWYTGNACATAIFEMSGGLRFTYRGSWCSEGRHTAWDSDWRAVGSHGTATWDGLNAPVADAVRSTGAFLSEFESITAELPPQFDEGIAGSLRDFLRAIETGETPMGECHDNIKSLAMVFGAIESARQGARIRLPEF
jgi:predicted dehydrogenase